MMVEGCGCDDCATRAVCVTERDGLRALAGRVRDTAVRVVMRFPLLAWVDDVLFGLKRDMVSSPGCHS